MDSAERGVGSVRCVYGRGSDARTVGTTGRAGDTGSVAAMAAGHKGADGATDEAGGGGANCGWVAGAAGAAAYPFRPWKYDHDSGPGGERDVRDLTRTDNLDPAPGLDRKGDGVAGVEPGLPDAARPCTLYTSPSPRDGPLPCRPSSA